MNYLLIDNSNSRTKFILADEEGFIGDQHRVQTAEVSNDLLTEHLKDWSYDAVLVCSVVPEKGEMMREFFTDIPFHLLKYDSPHDIQITYPNPEQIGADRIANAIGVSSLYSAPAVVIDFGTAVTFDVIDDDGAYSGGVIAPGLGSMTDYLHKKTALLPYITIEEPEQAIGRSTVEAMQSGAVYGYRGLVSGILTAIQREMKNKPVVIATGGDGKVIADGMTEIDYFSNKITLEGLRSAALSIFSTTSN